MLDKMKYNRAATINSFVRDISNGQMAFSEVRKKLTAQELDDTEISIVVRQVDKEVQRNAQIKSIHERGQSIFYLGLLLCVVGIIVTIGTYTGFIDLGSYYVIAFGPVFGGFALAVKGRADMKRR